MRVSHASRRFKVMQDKSATLKEFLVRRKRATFTELWALNDVSFEIRPGEAVGIVGRNGSGKSTLLKLLAGIIPPHSGTVEAGGSVASMLELGAGFHPDFTGRENVYMNGAIHGLSDREISRRIDDIVDFAGIPDFIDMPVRTYSSGMQMRLAFAVAAHVDPDIMLLDEVLAVGDEAFQRKCMSRIFEFRRGGGTLVFVSHDSHAVEHVCSRAILIDNGRVLMDGTPPEVMERYHRMLAEIDTHTRLEPVRESSTVNDDAGGDAARPRGWGTMPALIESVRVVSGGVVRNSVVSGDPIRIELTLSAPEELPTPNIGFSITAGDGSLMFGTNTRMAEFPVATIAGTSVVAFDVPQLALHEGEFDINVAVVSQDESTVFHWLDGADHLTVYSQGPGTGPAAISGTWSLVSSGVSTISRPGR